MAEVTLPGIDRQISLVLILVGLQCHTAPHSWKLVFECDHQLFEITMSACSPKEELEWRSRIVDRSYKPSLGPGDQAAFTSLSLKVKPLGTVFGKPGKSQVGGMVPRYGL